MSIGMGALLGAGVVTLYLRYEQVLTKTRDAAVTFTDEERTVLSTAIRQPLNLIKERNTALPWTPFVEDTKRRSYAYLLRRGDVPSFFQDPNRL